MTRINFEETSSAHLNHSLFTSLVSRITSLNVNEQCGKAIDQDGWSHSHLVKSWPLWWLKCNPLLLLMGSMEEWPRRQWWSFLTCLFDVFSYNQGFLCNYHQKAALKKLRNRMLSSACTCSCAGGRYLFKWLELVDKELELPSHLRQRDLNTFAL